MVHKSPRTGDPSNLWTVSNAPHPYRHPEAKAVKERCGIGTQRVVAPRRQFLVNGSRWVKRRHPRALALGRNELEAERRQLRAQLPGSDAVAVALHANAAERYRQMVADVHAALTKSDGSRWGLGPHLPDAGSFIDRPTCIYPEGFNI